MLTVFDLFQFRLCFNIQVGRVCSLMFQNVFTRGFGEVLPVRLFLWHNAHELCTQISYSVRDHLVFLWFYYSAPMNGENIEKAPVYVRGSSNQAFNGVL